MNLKLGKRLFSHGVAIWLVAFLMAPLSGECQDPQLVDSLENLASASQPDSVRVKAYFKLAWIHFTNDSEAAKDYTVKAAEIGHARGDSGSIIKAIYYHGLNNRLQGNYSTSLEHLQEALAFYERSEDEMQKTGTLFNKRHVYQGLLE